MAYDDSSPFARADGSSLTVNSALERFRRHGYLWFRPTDASNSSRGDVVESLRRLYAANPEILEERWTVENSGSHGGDAALSASAVLGGNREENSVSSRAKFESGRFYVSTIVPRDPPGALKALLSGLLPFDGEAAPPLLDSCRHDGGAWMFLGINAPESHGDGTEETEASTSRRKRRRETAVGASSPPLPGRAEHVDEVPHSGTWHAQVSGSKTWLVRPDLRSDFWKIGGTDGGGLPDLSCEAGAERSDRGGRAWRIRAVVEEGDVFALSTADWYHRTELEASGTPSLSVARDFYLPESPGAQKRWETVGAEMKSKEEESAILCEVNIESGEIVLDEDDIPDNIPQSNDPNCALAEVEDEEDPDGSRIVLVAIKDISKGEPLAIGVDDSHDIDCGSSKGDDEACNAPEGIDPRCLVNKTWEEGEIVLRGDTIPEEVPRSLDPNCELVTEEGSDDCVLLRSLRALVCGEVITIAPDEDDEYEEIEYDLSTGELLRLDE